MLLSLEMAPEDLGEQRFTNDHDILVAMSVKLTRLLVDVEGIKTTVTTNQETRLRALENFRYWILGVSATVSFLGGLVTHILFGK